MALTSKFSTAKPVLPVASGGWPVRQVDGNGVALDDGITVYSVAKATVVVDVSGVTSDPTISYSIWRYITPSPTGHPVVRVDGNGNVITTPFNVGGGGAPNGEMEFNFASQSGLIILLEDI